MKKMLLVISLIGSTIKAAQAQPTVQARSAAQAQSAVQARSAVQAQCGCRANIFTGMGYLNSQYSEIPGGVPVFTPTTLAAAAADGNMISIYTSDAICPGNNCSGRLTVELTKGDGTVVAPLYTGGGWTSSSYSRVLIPVSALTPGINRLRVIAECNNGTNPPTQCTVLSAPLVLVSGGTQQRSCVNAVITPLCDSWTYVTTGNPHTFGGYTGEISFKIEASVPTGCAAPVYIKLTRPDGISETKGFNSLTHIPTNYPFNTSTNGTYTVDFLDIFNTIIYSYSYKKTRMSCFSNATYKRLDVSRRQLLKIPNQNPSQ